MLSGARIKPKRLPVATKALGAFMAQADNFPLRSLTALRYRCGPSSPQKKFAGRRELFLTLGAEEENSLLARQSLRFSSGVTTGAILLRLKQGAITMGYDLYGKKPTASEGEYFRRNIWHWPPLVQLCRDLAPQESRGCKGWEENAGYGLNAADSLRLASKLSQLSEDGTITSYLAQNKSPPETHLQSAGKQFAALFAKSTGATVQCCDDVMTDEQDVREFIAFLRSCGGFEIV